MENLRVTNKHMNLNRILIILFVYYILYHTSKYYIIQPKVYDFSRITFHLFLEPNLLDLVIVTGGCFYIHTVASRFSALNDAWKRLPLNLVEISGEWIQSEITMSMECIRLLHVDLCEIINVFSLGYGMVLLGYFTLSFISLLIFTYLYFAIGYPPPDTSFISISGWCLPLIIRYCQYSISHISILIYASSTNKKKKEIISYLRLCQISNLPIHTKLQIKLFINQMPEFESNEMSAYGVFNINLHLIITNIILLFSGILTLIQMRDNPIISRATRVIVLRFKNAYNYMKKIYF
ncbi:uncharacterized protein LOC112598027 [Melanaphis sacchari]|uniref:uncharacterized protein LOC112598027 n=1 Tax=Melanaphis sacchari TaxID=742174 RepID=UPI000DC144DB|nr:uncharacterized protein LOC112598027 [Melanaphis sacchari]